MALPPSSDSPRPLKPVQDTRLAEPRFKASVPAANTPSTLGVDDVLFTLFRHKKKIILFALLGLAAAAAVQTRGTKRASATPCMSTSPPA